MQKVRIPKREYTDKLYHLVANKGMTLEYAKKVMDALDYEVKEESAGPSWKKPERIIFGDISMSHPLFSSSLDWGRRGESIKLFNKSLSDHLDSIMGIPKKRDAPSNAPGASQMSFPRAVEDHIKEREEALKKVAAGPSDTDGFAELLKSFNELQEELDRELTISRVRKGLNLDSLPLKGMLDHVMKFANNKFAPSERPAQPEKTEQKIDLLTPRIEVLKVEPGAKVEIGQIITMDNSLFNVPSIRNHGGYCYTMDFYIALPYLKDYYRLLNWWERREKKDMPKYLELQSGTILCIKDWWNDHGTWRWDDRNHGNICPYISCAPGDLPSTEGEYKAFLESKKGAAGPVESAPKNWWEGKFLKDMPLYIKEKIGTGVYKVTGWDDNYRIVGFDKGMGAGGYTDNYLPATKEEYDAFKGPAAKEIPKKEDHGEVREFAKWISHIAVYESELYKASNYSELAENWIKRFE